MDKPDGVDGRTALPTKFKKAATVFELWNYCGRDILMQLAVVRHIGQLRQLQLRKHGQNRRWCEHAMRIKANSLPPDRRRQIECSAHVNQPLQLLRRPPRPVGIDGIAITSEPDMLDDVQAGQAGY